jgi:hypothetical protein
LQVGGGNRLLGVLVGLVLVAAEAALVHVWPASKWKHHTCKSHITSTRCWLMCSAQRTGYRHAEGTPHDVELPAAQEACSFDTPAPRQSGAFPATPAAIAGVDHAKQPGTVHTVTRAAAVGADHVNTSLCNGGCCCGCRCRHVTPTCS